MAKTCLSLSGESNLQKEFANLSPLVFSDAHKTLQIIDKHNNQYTLTPCKKYAEAHGEQLISKVEVNVI